MKAASEAGFQRTVLDAAKLYGWRTAHFRPAKTAKGWRTAVSGDGRGFPDIVLVRRNRIIFAELKVGKNKLTPEQAEWFRALHDTPVELHLWHPDNWKDIEASLK